MMIASEALHQAGYRVTTVHPALIELQDWLPHHTFFREVPPSLEGWDLVIVENDNSPKLEQLKKLRSPNLSIFYPTYSPAKHAPLSPLDQCFDAALPFAENMALAMQRLLQKEILSKDNGLKIPSGLVQHRFKERILLHPMSSQAQKNWHRSKYLALARKLQKQGLSPVFIVSPKEHCAWQEVEQEGFLVPTFPSLLALAEFTYESKALIGNDSLMGHLASNLGLPTLIIADDPRRMQLWRPAWTPGQLITPPAWTPKPLRKNHWQHFISTQRVLKTFAAATKQKSDLSLGLKRP